MSGKNLKIITPFSLAYCQATLEALHNKILLRQHWSYKLIVKIDETTVLTDVVKFRLHFAQQDHSSEDAVMGRPNVKGILECQPDGKTLVTASNPLRDFLYGLSPTERNTQTAKLYAIVHQLFAYPPPNPDEITNAYIQQAHLRHEEFLKKHTPL